MRPIPFNVPWLAGNEQAMITEAFANRVFGGHGPFARRCMRHLEELHGAQRALITSSCTGALEMAALLLNLQPGDEVLVPSFTFVATASAFLRCGARPVFVEVDPRTMTMCPVDAERRITKRTRAIAPIHYAGISADMTALQALATTHNLVIVEDAAQGLDAFLDGQRLGTFAPLAAFSFHETKNIHCGIGGALLVNDPQYVERAEFIWHRGTDRSRMLRGMTDKYTWVELGSSFYPSDLQAAFLLAQLESLDRNTAERGRAWNHYQEQLAPLAAAGLFALPTIAENQRINYHCYFLLARTAQERENLRVHLADRGIAAYVHYVPLHSSPMGRRLGWRAQDLPVTEDTANRLLRLPMHTALSDEDLQRVTDAIRAFYGNTDTMH